MYCAYASTSVEINPEFKLESGHCIDVHRIRIRFIRILSVRIRIYFKRFLGTSLTRMSTLYALCPFDV